MIPLARLTVQPVAITTYFHLLIHPQSRPVGIIIFAHVVRPSVPTFKSSKTKEQKTIVAIGRAVGLAEWIIDDTCLVICFVWKVGTDRRHMWKQWSQLAVIVGWPSGSNDNTVLWAMLTSIVIFMQERIWDSLSFVNSNQLCNAFGTVFLANVIFSFVNLNWNMAVGFGFNITRLNNFTGYAIISSVRVFPQQKSTWK